MQSIAARTPAARHRTHLRSSPTSPLLLFFSSFGLRSSSSCRACSCSGWPAQDGGHRAGGVHTTQM